MEFDFKQDPKTITQLTKELNITTKQVKEHEASTIRKINGYQDWCSWQKLKFNKFS